MAKQIDPKQKPSEIPKTEEPEITPDVVPDKQTPPFEEPEIIPEDEPGGTSPAEMPVPDSPEEPIAPKA